MFSWKTLYIGLLGAFLLAVITRVSLPDRKFTVWFLDVGQGDSILIRTPAQQKILIDGGPGTYVIEELGEVLHFFEKTIDLVILTHPEKDHMEGLIAVLRHYDVKNVLLTGVSSDSFLYKVFLEELRSRRIPTFVVSRDEDFDLGNGVFIDILAPLEVLSGKTVEPVNNSSLIFRVLYGQKSFYFSGDAEQIVELSLLQTDLDLDADILKVPHHGSKTSSIFPYLSAISPDIAVIQVGKNNRYRHPDLDVVTRLQSFASQLFRTDLHGRVDLQFDGNEVRVFPEHSHR